MDASEKTSEKASNLPRLIGKLLRELLVIVVLICFVLVTTITSLLSAIHATVLSHENWHHLIDETQLAERSRGIIADLLVTYALRTVQEDTYLEDYPRQTWQGVAEVILPTHWVYENLTHIVDSSLDWLHNPRATLPQVSLDLSPVIVTLRGPQGALSVLPLMQSIPICGDDVREIEFMTDQLMTCLPEGRDLTRYGAIIAASVVSGLPEQVSIETLQSAGLIKEDVYLLLSKIRAAQQVMNGALSFGFRLALFFLCLFALLQSPAWKRVASTLPRPFYAAAGFSLLLLVAWYIFLQWGLGLAVTVGLSALELETQVLLVDFVRALSRILTTTWLRWILILLGAGLLLQILAFGLKKWEQHRQAMSAPLAPHRQQVRKQFR